MGQGNMPKRSVHERGERLNSLPFHMFGEKRVHLPKENGEIYLWSAMTKMVMTHIPFSLWIPSFYSLFASSSLLLILNSSFPPSVSCLLLLLSVESDWFESERLRELWESGSVIYEWMNVMENLYWNYEKVRDWWRWKVRESPCELQWNALISSSDSMLFC